MLTYDMDARGDDTLYGYLYRRIKDDILGGRINPGSRLPPKRKLAVHLGVGTITVEAAYRQLVAEGYVEARERSGYYVVDLRQSGFALEANARPGFLSSFSSRTSSYSAGLSDANAQSARSVDDCSIADFTGASSSTGIFPYEQWARTLRSVLTDETEESLVAASGPAGCERLRVALSEYLRGSRGMDVSADQIVVGAGAQVLYGLLVQLLGRDARYAIETPGYPRLSKIYHGNDVQLDFLPMDGLGVTPQALKKTQANVLHLMPSHQFPSGCVYPISRRYELLAWASRKSDRWIIEDDFDCEFRLEGRPIPSLQSIDAQGCVIYANTFTKSLGPAYRLGYMVLPLDLARRFRDQLGFYSCTVGTLDQITLAHFLESGEYERHVNRLRTHYRRVRDALVGVLRASKLVETHGLSVEGADAGLHFVMSVDDDRAEEELVDLARSEGVGILPYSRFKLGEEIAVQDVKRRFVMNFSGVEADCAEPFVLALEKAWT